MTAHRDRQAQVPRRQRPEGPLARRPRGLARRGLCGSPGRLRFRLQGRRVSGRAGQDGHRFDAGQPARRGRRPARFGGLPSRPRRQGHRDLVRRGARRLFGPAEDAEPQRRAGLRAAAPGALRAAARPRCGRSRARAVDREPQAREQGPRRGCRPGVAGSRLPEPSLWAAGARHARIAARHHPRRPRRGLPSLPGARGSQDRGGRAPSMPQDLGRMLDTAFGGLAGQQMR